MKINYKHVPVSEETYESLKQLGTLGDTFDSVIRKLMEVAKSK